MSNIDDSLKPAEDWIQDAFSSGNKYIEYKYRPDPRHPGEHEIETEDIRFRYTQHKATRHDEHFKRSRYQSSARGIATHFESEFVDDVAAITKRFELQIFQD